MRRILFVGSVVLTMLLFAAPAMASSTVNFSATFHDPFGGPVSSPFSCPAGQASCGSGEVVGLGQATEFITETGCPGPTCAQLLHVEFADGSKLVGELHASNFQVPGNSFAQSANSFGNPFSLTLIDTVDGTLSTGMFAGAAGTLTGEVHLAGGMQIITLSGPITLA